MDLWHRKPSDESRPMNCHVLGRSVPEYLCLRKSYADILLSVPGAAFNVVCGIFIKRV
jgi:hypothetical protein